MPTLNSVIQDFVAGDHLKISRTITNVPASDSLAKCWLTIKRREGDLDTAAIVQKSISSTYVQGQGQITDTGADTAGALFFELTNTDTALLIGGTVYFFDLQVKTTNGAIYTPESGKIIAKAQITRATT